MYLGIDIGSVSLNLVLLDDQMRVVKERYIRTRGKPLETALAALEEVFGEVPPLRGPARPSWANCTASRP